MLERDEHGMLTLDLDAFLACLDQAVAEHERLRQLAEHITELAYPPDLAEFKELFPDSADRLDWDFALHVRKDRAGSWRIFGRSDVTWNRQPHWAPSWAGVTFPTLEQALADLPDAIAAHTEVCRVELRAAADRFRQRHEPANPEPEGGAHDCG